MNRKENPTYQQEQSMTYLERERLKKFAYAALTDNDAKSLAHTLIMIAHWMRQTQRIPFNEYAMNWIEAERQSSCAQKDTTLRMIHTWPHHGPRRIDPGYSE